MLIFRDIVVYQNSYYCCNVHPAPAASETKGISLCSIRIAVLGDDWISSLSDMNIIDITNRYHRRQPICRYSSPGKKLRPHTMPHTWVSIPINSINSININSKWDTRHRYQVAKLWQESRRSIHRRSTYVPGTR